MDLEMDLAMHQFSKVRTWVHHQDFSYFLWFSSLLSMKDLAFLAMDLEMVMVMVLAITSLAIHTQQSGLPPGRFLTSWRRQGIPDWDKLLAMAAPWGIKFN